jgi:hypothetical protein
VPPAIYPVCKALQVRKGKVWSPSRTEKEEQSVGASLVYAAADEVPSVVLSCYSVYLLY